MPSKFYCNTCKNETNHEILFEKIENSEEVEYPFWWTISYFFAECKGCSDNHFIKIYQDSSFDAEDVSMETFPPRKSEFRSTFLDGKNFCFYNYPNLYKIYKETVCALESNLLQLSGSGIRICVEELMNIFLQKENTLESDIEHMNMTEKLNKVFNLGYINTSELEIIREVIDFGHASIHRNYMPKKENIIICMNVLESIINSKLLTPEHLQPSHLSAIKNTTPKRLPKPPKEQSAPKSPPE